MMVNNNLVGGIPIPLTNHGVCHLGYVGIMKFPTEWKKNHVPNHRTLSHFAMRATLCETLPDFGGSKTKR